MHVRATQFQAQSSYSTLAPIPGSSEAFHGSYLMPNSASTGLQFGLGLVGPSNEILRY